MQQSRSRAFPFPSSTVTPRVSPRVSSGVSAALCALWLAAPAIGQNAEKAVNLEALRAEAREALGSNDFEVAAANFQKIVAVAPDDGTSWQLLGYSLHALGKLDEALPIHKKAAAFPGVAGVASYNAACVYALRGDKEQAFAWLEKAAAGGFDRPEHIENDSDMDGLRDDPRFSAIMKKIDGQASPDRMQVFVMKNERKCSRVAWFSGTGSPGQIAIDYSPVAWQSKYDEMARSDEMVGKKWRFGADFWTTLDTSVDMSFGDVKVPAGYYYLTLEQSAPGQFVLGAHDAAEVKKLRLDAFVAHKLEGGIEIPLVHEKTDEVAKALSIAIELESGSQDMGAFVTNFGGHRLSVPVKMKVGAQKDAQKDAKK